MRYELLAPHKGATHIHFYEVLVTPGNSVRLTGWYGFLDAEGDFISDPEIRQPVRTIAGREYDAFQDEVEAQGAPPGNFRAGDLAEWISAWGHAGDGEEWYAEHPVSEEA